MSAPTRDDARVARPVLNREVPDFQQHVPTAENIVRFCWNALKGELAPAVLDHMRLVETSNNSVAYRGEEEREPAT